MNQATLNPNQQEWLKILGKGMVTIPKKWREEMGITSGDIVKARKEGNRLVIEPQQDNLAPYRVYNDTEIDAFLQEDKLPDTLTKKIKDDLASLT